MTITKIPFRLRQTLLTILLPFCLLFFQSSLSQSKNNKTVPNPKYATLFKTIPKVSDNDPLWVHLLYSNEPNLYKIEDAFTTYYQEHSFKKSIHTQNFKYFSKQIRNLGYLKPDGSIYIPSNIESQQMRGYNHASNINSSSSNWQSIGPIDTFNSGGNTKKSSQTNIYTLDQSLSNPNILYSGSETGAVFKTTDKGETWSSVGDNIFDSGGIGTIKIDPLNENIVYVGVGNYIYKTIDGGVSWTQILNINNLGANQIIINPTATNFIYITGNSGLLKSTDSGNTWSTIYSDKCWDVKFKTDDPNTIFVAKSNSAKKITEIFKSTDNGLTFSLKDSGWYSPLGGIATSEGGARMATTNADPNRLYVILLGEENDAIDDNNFIGIYRSDDAGESWHTPYDGNGDGQPDNEPGGPYSNEHWCFTHFGVTGTGYDQGFYNLAIEISDTNPDNFMVGSLNLFKSEDGGVTYTRWGGYGCTGCGSEYRHPDIQDIDINGQDVWVSSDGGIDYYNGNLDFIASKNKGINGSSYWGFDQGWNHDVLVGGRYHNGNAAYYETYGNGNFLSLGGGESATGYVNKGENRKVFHSDISGKEIPDVLTGTIHDIPAYTLFPNENYFFSQRSEIINDPRFWNVLYAGKDNKLWKSNDGGATFSLVKEFGSTISNLVKGIEISRNDPKIIFVVQRTGTWTGTLWKSIDGGMTWSEVNLPSDNRNIYISLNTENELFLAFNHGYSNTNKIFKSNDLGNTWQNLTTSVLNGESLENVQVQNGTDGGVYITTNKKIWYRNNSLTEWQAFSQGLPVNFRICKILPFYRDGKIRVAGTRGIWERSFYESSTPKAQPMASQKQVNCSRQIVQFEDFSILNHTNASWQWQFPGAATVSSLTSRNPKVTYNTPGNYNVSLTVTNNNGTSTKTISNMITVGDNYCSPEAEAQMALECIDNNDYLLNNTINVPSITNFSFTGWIKPNGIQNNNAAIFSLSSGSGNELSALNFRESNNTLGIHWNGSQYWWDSNLIVPADKWSFIAITVTPSEIKLYVNEHEATLSYNSTPFDLNRIIIGSYYGWGSRNYKGLIEETSFWNKTLTSSEIRLARHLTKNDVSDPNLLAYYQFNHDVSGIIYDKKAGYDLSKNGGVNLGVSDAPIGPGVSKLLNISSPGTFNYNEADLLMTIPTSGTTPNGNIVVSRLDVLPSSIPQNMNAAKNSYWIINNYGTNTTFSVVENIEFLNISDANILLQSDTSLFTRADNSAINNSWIDRGNASSINSNSIIFDNTINIDSFNKQFFIGSNQTLSNNNFETNFFAVYPNPLGKDNILHIKGKIDQNTSILIFDTNGKEVFRKKKISKEIQLPNLTSGMYFYIFENQNHLFRGKLIIK